MQSKAFSMPYASTQALSFVECFWKNSTLHEQKEYSCRKLRFIFFSDIFFFSTDAFEYLIGVPLQMPNAMFCLFFLMKMGEMH